MILQNQNLTKTDLKHETRNRADATIIVQNRLAQGEAPTTLATLPASFAYAPRMPWGVVPTAVLAKLLSLDRGLLGTWINRGIGPEPLPADWFKPGRANYWRIDHVHLWLAKRRGEPFDRFRMWRDWIDNAFHDPGPDTLAFAQNEAAGPWCRRLAAEDGVKFKSAGFNAYVASLAE